MNIQLFYQGLIEIALSLLTGLFVYFVSFKVFTILTKDIDELSELKKNNISIAILISSFVFGIMIIVKSVISPAMDTLGFTINSINIGRSMIIYTVGRIILFYLIAGFFAFVLLWLSIRLFMILTTQIDEMTEIKNNNMAISIIIATLIISLSIILFLPLKTLLNGFVAPPAVTDNMKEALINFKIFLQGSIELIVSIISTVLLFFYVFKLFNFLTKNFDEVEELKENNVAVSILVSSFIFAMMLLIKASLVPVFDTLGYTLSGSIHLKSILFSISQIVIFFIISAVFAFILLWLSMKAFMIFTTTIDEIAEIKNKNIAIAIVVAILIISASLIVEHGLSTLLSGFIKTPEIGRGLLDISNFR